MHWTSARPMRSTRPRRPTSPKPFVRLRRWAPGTPLPGDLMNAVTFGHTVKGIIEGDSDPDDFIPELISLYNQGRLPVDRLVKTYPLEEINRAVADQHAGKCVKVVLTMDRP